MRRVLVASMVLVGAALLVAAIPLAAVPDELRDAAVPGAAIAQAYSGRALAVTVGLLTAGGTLALDRRRVPRARTPAPLAARHRRCAQSLAWIAIPFLAARRDLAPQPGPVLRRPDQAVARRALRLAARSSSLVFPRFRRGALALALATVASGLAAWGMYTLIAALHLDVAGRFRSCQPPLSSGRSGATKARGRSSTCSRSSRISCAATRAARTRGTRSWSATRRSRSGRSRRGSSTGKTCVIGAAASSTPRCLSRSSTASRRSATRRASVYVSGNAHLIMPWHVAIDQASERRLGRLQIGTTKRGIGPAYADKASRIGIRVQDVLDPKILRQKIEVALAEKNLWLERIYEVDPFDLEEVASRLRGATRSGSGRTSPTPRCSSTRRSAPASRCSSRARRRRCSTSTTARIRSSPRRTRSRRARRPGSASARRGSTPSSASRRRTSRASARGRSRRRSTGPTRTRVRDLGGEYGTVTGQPALRLARPRRAALRGARERHRPARAHEARRPLGTSPSCRCACATRCATAPRASTSRRTRATSTRAETGLRDAPRLGGAARRVPLARRPPRCGARATSSSSSGSSTSRSTLIGTGAERESVLTRAA